MATTTPVIRLKRIEDADDFGQEIINENTDILETTLAAIQEDTALIAPLETTVEEHTEDISSLSGRITTNAQNISQTATDLAALTADVYTKAAADERYNRERAVMFSATGQIIRYPWAGYLTEIQVNCSTTRTADIDFYIDKQSGADYLAGSTTWTRIGGTGTAQTLSYSVNYAAFAISADNELEAGDMLRITIAEEADNFLVQAVVTPANIATEESGE